MAYSCEMGSLATNLEQQYWVSGKKKLLDIKHAHLYNFMITITGKIDILSYAIGLYGMSVIREICMTITKVHETLNVFWVLLMLIFVNEHRICL